MDKMNSFGEHERIEMFEVLQDVVQAIVASPYGKSFVIRGGFVLMSLLKETGNEYLNRQTTDVDIDFSDRDTWEQFLSDLPNILNRGTQNGFQYQIVKRRGFDKNPSGDSISLVCTKGGKSIQSKIDMNIREFGNRKLYQSSDISFTGSAVNNMLCDKLAVVSTSKVCRRIKDLYDIFVLSKTCDFSIQEIIQEWKITGHTMGEPVYIFDAYEIGKVKHAYSLFRGIENKPDFDPLFARVVGFTSMIFEDILMASTKERHWNREEGIWRY